ncbi:MAG: DUF3244 domain-containing protein [Bacteroidaceae bacterium]|nr:DUF3244 domain-containing protein [Bacteroidaceae bacterium]
MNKFFLSVVLFVGFASVTTVSAKILDNTTELEGNPIILVKKGIPSSPINPKSLIPRFVPSPVDAWLADGYLYFNNDEEIYDVEVSIFNEDGENISSSIIDVFADSPNMIDISFLSSGYYTLNVTINGVEYYAYFDM